MLQLNWFFDFHSHPAAPIAQRPQYDDVANQLADVGVGEVTFHAKCHMGFAYYPSDVGTRHPNLTEDVFGKLVEACKRRGLKVMGYYSFGIDGQAGQQRPEWLKQLHDGPHVWRDWFAYVCPFTGYADELALPQVEEIVSRYAIDGLWFDTMSAWAPCFCEHCVAAFRAQHGDAPPRDSEHALAGAFRRARAEALMRRTEQLVHAHLPACELAFNQMGAPPLPGPLPKGFNRVSLDYAVSGPQSRQASLCAAFATSLPYESEVIPTLFNHGWADWSAAPPARHAQIAAAVWARRAALNMGDRLHPHVQLTEDTRAATAQLHAQRQHLKALMPPSEATPAPDVVLLHAETSQYGADDRFYSVDPRERQATLDGMHGLLLDVGCNFTICPEHALAEALRPSRLVVLPETEAIAPATDRALQQFVRAGGQVLLVGSRLPTVDGTPIDWTGVTQQDEPLFDQFYIPPVDGDRAAGPVLVRGDYFATHSTEAQVVAPLIEPMCTAYGERFGWGAAPPGDCASDHAALTCRPLGDGVVWYLAAPLASAYHQLGSWQHVMLTSALLRLVQPEPICRVESSHGHIEPVVYQSATSTFVVLVNHGGEHLSGPGRWARTWGAPPPCDVRLNLAIPTGKMFIAATVDDRPCDATVEADTVRLELTAESFCTVVALQWDPVASEVAQTATLK